MSDRAARANVVRIAVLGATGRMGRAVAAAARQAPGVVNVGGIAASARSAHESRSAGFDRIAGLADPDAREILEAANVLVDFSTPAALAEFATAHEAALAGRAFVTGTTGLDADAVRVLDRLSRNAAVLDAPNFSIGVNLMLALVERAAAALDAGSYDVEVIETHHRGKADAPSGTALALGRAVARARRVTLEDVRRDGRSGRPGERPRAEIGFHAVRGGAVAGEHRVLFLGARERIELVHEASDRTLFAEGAVAAARWIAGRPAGRYTMADVLGL